MKYNEDNKRTPYQCTVHIDDYSAFCKIDNWCNQCVGLYSQQWNTNKNTRSFQTESQALLFEMTWGF